MKGLMLMLIFGGVIGYAVMYFLMMLPFIVYQVSRIIG